MLHRAAELDDHFHITHSDHNLLFYIKIMISAVLIYPQTVWKCNKYIFEALFLALIGSLGLGWTCTSVNKKISALFTICFVVFTAHCGLHTSSCCLMLWTSPEQMNKPERSHVGRLQRRCSAPRTSGGVPLCLIIFWCTARSHYPHLLPHSCRVPHIHLSFPRLLGLITGMHTVTVCT